MQSSQSRAEANPSMPQLSEWLKLMNAEIARKRDDDAHAREEDARRAAEGAPGTAAPVAEPKQPRKAG